ncbi:MAG: acyl-CoA carboxylase subunit epsilon [Microbacteriaceae bacterium]|nr:acyl-CoA carboxylase subunit epsilon [Microbacteriaceae bacterium]HOB56410.1 acyl-CoA carboxylase subunit epsilon [Rhodoglobus sp.]HOT32831.1 acyl-CoA carboxylase subunit epsilon [Rhodoglobus sp.]HOW00420.1 acyl-CoA carboxylase subunit epsilon [Rhodoglobus sp.]HOY82087.1 acyl-CoA carboxylase subunit epsilon [Rhodoglobus sp.]
MSEDSAFRIISKNATDEEIAAVSAVLQVALDELAAAQGPDDGPVVSAWNRSQRGLRSPLTPGPGAWRSF